MRPIVFLGPSLSEAEARAVLDAEYRPPAAQGDLYRAAASRPKPHAIGLVDGVFQSVPAVRHKEILWALSEGVHVFGAASIGALRAAELDAFGMRGVGRIFEAYRDGLLEDDDEVALDHAPAAMGHMPLAEPLVNMRATLESAADQGVIRAETQARMLGLARGVFYKERSYADLLTRASGAGIPADEIEAFETWLPEGRIDQKRADALAMLRAMGDFLVAGPAPFAPSWRFERTEAWEEDIELALAAAPVAGRPSSGPTHDAVLDELRLQPGAWARLRREALAFALALREGRRAGLSLDAERCAAAVATLRREAQAAGQDSAAWLDANHLDEVGLAELAKLRAQVERIEDLASVLVDRHLLDVLRSSGQYAPLAARATRKLRLVSDRGLEDAHPADLHLSPGNLAEWYFRRRLGRPVPHDLDRYAVAQGFADATTFFAALAREYLLWQEEEGTSPSH